MSDCFHNISLSMYNPLQCMFALLKIIMFRIKYKSSSLRNVFRDIIWPLSKSNWWSLRRNPTLTYWAFWNMSDSFFFEMKAFIYANHSKIIDFSTYVKSVPHFLFIQITHFHTFNLSYSNISRIHKYCPFSKVQFCILMLMFHYSTFSAIAQKTEQKGLCLI